ncbi:MAG: 3-deoxy-D-manno-octulosonic acid transferase [Thermogutta sp.]
MNSHACRGTHLDTHAGLSTATALREKEFPMSILFDIAYLALLILVSPVLIYRSVTAGKYRRGWAQRLLGTVPYRKSRRPCIWFHAVSVGEVHLLPPLVQALRWAYPHWDVVISTTTQTGMEVARKRFPDLTVFYSPLDFSWAVARVFYRVRPSVLVLTELEIWPNLIRAAKARGVRVAIINARLGDKSFAGYRRARFALRPIFAAIDLIAVQDAEGKRRFQQLGAHAAAVHVTGSMKYDGAQSDRDNPATARLRNLAGIGRDEVVWIAGSTQEEEEVLALSVAQKLSRRFPKLRLIVVPRHPERFDAVADMLSRSGMPWLRRSQLGDGPDSRVNAATSPEGATSGALPSLPILLVDSVGELAAWWGMADVALVGGSFGRRGGQNMIEPAAYGAAVCFGPNTWNFRDVVRHFLAAEAAVVVRDKLELERFVTQCLQDPEYRRELGKRAADLVASHRGAVDRTLALLAPWLESGARDALESNDRSPEIPAYREAG